MTIKSLFLCHWFRSPLLCFECFLQAFLKLAGKLIVAELTHWFQIKLEKFCPEREEENKTHYSLLLSCELNLSNLSSGVLIILCFHAQISSFQVIKNSFLLSLLNTQIYRHPRNFVIKISKFKQYTLEFLCHCIGKPTICTGENKGADQLRSNCEADQRLYFCYTDSTTPLLSKSKISSL